MDNTDNNTLPISGLEDLQTHIAQLVGDPLATFDAKLFDHVELQLNGKHPLFSLNQLVRICPLLFSSLLLSP